MTISIRRTAARVLSVTLLGVALSMLASAGTADADGSGTELTAKGWWWQANKAALPTDPPAPPNVGADQLWIQGSPPDKTAFAAVHFAVDPTQVAQTLTLTVGANGDTGGSSAVVLACQTGSTWVAAQGGKWETAPTVNSNACVNGTRSEDGATWAFAVGTLQTGEVLDVSFVPGADPNTGIPSTFSLVFDAPADASLATASGTAPTPTTTGSTSPSGGADATLPAGTGAPSAGSTFHAPPAAPIATGLPADKIGETATSPAKQAASQANLNQAIADSTPAKDRNKTPGYLVLALAAAIGMYAWRQDNLIAMNGGTAPGAPDEPGGLGRFSRPRHGSPPALT